jgi:hypothetical protein
MGRWLELLRALKSGSSRVRPHKLKPPLRSWWTSVGISVPRWSLSKPHLKGTVHG